MQSFIRSFYRFLAVLVLLSSTQVRAGIVEGIVEFSAYDVQPVISDSSTTSADLPITGSFSWLFDYDFASSSTGLLLLDFQPKSVSLSIGDTSYSASNTYLTSRWWNGNFQYVSLSSGGVASGSNNFSFGACNPDDCPFANFDSQLLYSELGVDDAFSTNSVDTTISFRDYRPNSHSVPEMDASGATISASLLLIFVLVMRERRALSNLSPSR